MDSIGQKRGEVIVRFNNVEMLLSGAIARHYIPVGKGISLPFLKEVLYDEYFHYGLKVRILGKIIGESTPLIQNMNRVGKIRNIFAHAGTTVRLAGTSVDITVNLSQSIQEELDYEGLYTEFMKKVSLVEQGLGEFLQQEGCTLHKGEDLSNSCEQSPT